MYQRTTVFMFMTWCPQCYVRREIPGIKKAELPFGNHQRDVIIVTNGRNVLDIVHFPGVLKTLRSQNLSPCSGGENKWGVHSVRPIRNVESR
jgi:hypothetical protein